MFKFENGQEAKITISGEKGIVKGRADYLEAISQYYLVYKSADGKATDGWFSESELEQG